MNNEIKEINIKIPGQILDYVDTKEHLLELFNYITNLQQAIRDTKDTADDMLYELKQENERLKENLQQEKKDFKEANDYCFELKDYKSRCEKAIEFIKEKQKVFEWYDTDLYWLLNILQNGSDDDDK